MSATPHDGAGTVLTFGGTAYTVTNIVYNLSDPATDDKIDVSHLGITAGNEVRTIDRPLKGSVSDTGREVQIEYLGKAVIEDASTGTLVITHAGASLLSKAATVSASTLTFATNDAIRGTATFRVAR